jgi:hypothetical protein
MARIKLRVYGYFSPERYVEGVPDILKKITERR